LELSTGTERFACTYSRVGSILRAVATSLGSVRPFVFTTTAEGLVGEDGTVLYDEVHYEAARARLNMPKDAVIQPRPEYPYEARRKKITGSGVVVMTINLASGAVIDAKMDKSTGSPILDGAAVSAFRRWRFKPGSTASTIRMPIKYTLSGAQY
jgi:TonB family protein